VFECFARTGILLYNLAEARFYPSVGRLWEHRERFGLDEEFEEV
jgi:hypothetical protein